MLRENGSGLNALRMAAIVLVAATSTETWQLFSAIVALPGAKGKNIYGSAQD